MKKFNNHYYNKELLAYSRELRSVKATRAERYLWKSLLSKRQMNIKFLRQRPISNFIVDFFAPEIGLIIEIDGSSHLNKGKYDEKRANELIELGFIFLRFKEGEILNQLNDVAIKIEHAIEVLLSDLDSRL